MGKDREPWHLRNFNCASNVGASALANQGTDSVVFPNHADPYGFFHPSSGLMPPSCLGGFASGEKRFMVFDRSKNRTNLIYDSVGYLSSSALDLRASNETTVSNGDVNGEEMHEDTEEIDALLYSNSDNYDDEEEEEEEASTGHSPIEMPIGDFNNDEDVAASASTAVLPPPAKKRRIEPKLDPALADTASSANCGNGERKKSKREKIQDTVSVLRRIIPDGKGKDAASVLDEAIQYLRSLMLKANVPGVASTTSNLK